MTKINSHSVNKSIAFCNLIEIKVICDHGDYTKICPLHLAQ